VRKHPCWGCHILQGRQTPNKLWLCLCVVLSPPSFPLSPFSFRVLYIFTPRWVHCAHTHRRTPHTHTFCLSDCLLCPPPPPVVPSLPLPPLLHFPSYFSSSLHITLPPSPSLPLLSCLPPPSPTLLGHVAAAPAEIIGAKAWGCYLHRNSMTPQAASGEGHRDHLSQNVNENFCWDISFPPYPPPPPFLSFSFPNFHSSSVPSTPSDSGSLSSLLPFLK